MLDRLRGRLDGYLGSVGRAFSRVSGSPSVWTGIGLALSVLSGVLYAYGGYRGQLGGGAMILAAGWFDIVDGAVARVTNRASRRGAFLDSTLDRVAEVAVFLGILAGHLAPPMLVLAALSLSLLVSYARAKGDALGVPLSGVGIGERSERLLVLSVSSLLGYCGWGVLIVALIAGYTFVERVYRALSGLSKS